MSKTQTLSQLPISREKKIKRQHQERLAVVYIRQSSLNQVQQNQESTQLQYGLVSHAVSLGWPKERVLVIDDDLGVSGATAEGRIGFQRLLSDIALNHVGMILGVEMSRLARSCKDWYQLLELCGLFDTLICDLDGVYDLFVPHKTESKKISRPGLLVQKISMRQIDREDVEARTKEFEYRDGSLF